MKTDILSPRWLWTLARFSTGLYLFFVAIDGVARYYLPKVGLSFFVYVPKFLIVLVVFLFVVHFITSGKITPLGACIIFLIFLSSGVGLLFLSGYKQIAFGLFMLFPVFLGIFMVKDVYIYWKRYHNFIFAIYFVTIAGLLGDYFLKFPWEGYVYSIGEVQLVASRQWQMLGIERLAGFTRASTSAAAIVILSSMLLVLANKTKISKCLYWLLGFIAICLTTSKGLIGVYVLVTFFLFNQKRLFWVAAISLFWCLEIFLPVTSFFIKGQSIYGSQGLLSSLKGRLFETWPNLWHFISTRGNVLSGRGLGGVGTAQEMFEPQYLGLADNLFVFLYGQFGIWAFFIMVWVLINSLKINIQTSKQELFLGICAATILAYGVTNNILTGGFLAFVFGLLIGYFSLPQITKMQFCKNYGE